METLGVPHEPCCDTDLQSVGAYPTVPSRTLVRINSLEAVGSFLDSHMSQSSAAVFTKASGNAPDSHQDDSSGSD